MNNRAASIIVLLLVSLLMLAGCGAGRTGTGSMPPEGPQPPPGDNSPFTGRLIAEGTAKVHTKDLSVNGDWTVRLDSSVYEVIAVHQPAGELMTARATFGSPLTVSTHSLNNFALTDTFVWPDSAERDYGRVHGLAVSTDGKHLAAVISGVGDAFLEIVNRETKEVRFTGFLGMAGNDLHWLTDDLLVMSAHTPDPANNLAGAIVAVSLAELASGSGTVNMRLLVPFSADEWAVSQPTDFSFSHDGTEIVYSYNSDIWVRNLDDDLAPHQLTTGPTGLVGPVFSPDGRHLALVEYQAYSLRHTFVIPNHRADPVFIDGISTETDAYLLEQRTMVDTILLWH